jgi:hypothetical protein
LLERTTALAFARLWLEEKNEVDDHYDKHTSAYRFSFVFDALVYQLFTLQSTGIVLSLSPCRK